MDNRIRRTQAELRPLLRLLISNREAFDVPRKNAQSTSGLKTSQRTAPLLSRSIAMTSESPIRGFLDKAVRKYPRVVLQRRAKSSCSDVDSELRKDRSCSNEGSSGSEDRNISVLMGNHSLPAGKSLSSGAGHLPPGMDEYPVEMSTKDEQKDRMHAIRRHRLAQLVNEECAGSQAELARRLNASSLRVLGDPSYINRLLSGKPRAKGGKNISGDTAAEIERLMGKSPGWLSREGKEPPLTIEETVWETLNHDQRQALIVTVNAMLSGFIAEGTKQRPARREAATPHR